ncbi:MAG: restriction endonuclease [Desulfotalea sp.]
MLDVATTLPWWVNILLALLSFFIMTKLATLPPVDVGEVGQLGNAVFRQIFVTVGLFGRVIFPFIFILAAIVNILKKRNGKKLYDADMKLDDFSWREFEELTAEFFRRNGFEANTNFSDGPDGGVDVHLYKGGHKFFAQCKHWKKNQVGVSVVREMHSVIMTGNYDGAFIVASGTFTPDAKALAKKVRIKLVDGAKINAVRSNN